MATEPRALSLIGIVQVPLVPGERREYLTSSAPSCQHANAYPPGLTATFGSTAVPAGLIGAPELHDPLAGRCAATTVDPGPAQTASASPFGAIPTRGALPSADPG